MRIRSLTAPSLAVVGLGISIGAVLAFGVLAWIIPSNPTPAQAAIPQPTKQQLAVALERFMVKPPSETTELSFISRPVERYAPVVNPQVQSEVWNLVLTANFVSLDDLVACYKEHIISMPEKECDAQLKLVRADVRTLITQADIADTYSMAEHATMNRIVGFVWGKLSLTTAIIKEE